LTELAGEPTVEAAGAAEVGDACATELAGDAPFGCPSAVVAGRAGTRAAAAKTLTTSTEWNSETTRFFGAGVGAGRSGVSRRPRAKTTHANTAITVDNREARRDAVFTGDREAERGAGTVGP
jgi:hypothetical protein